MLKLDDATAEQIAPMLKEAVAAQITVNRSISQMENIIAGETCKERTRTLIEDTISQFVMDWDSDCETAEGFGMEDTKCLLEDLEIYQDESN
jgi:hypothetical protein